MFWTAFTIGALGSFHCIGMCGPIAMAMPMGAKSGVQGALRSLIYNLGRVLTYATLGLMVGLIGQRIALGGFQQALSISVGVLILLAMALPKRWTAKVNPTSKVAVGLMRMRSVFQGVFRSQSMVAPLALGMMNGLLPCGLVYIGLAGALAVGDPLQSAGFMALFGLGTLPMMLGAYLAGGFISVQWRANMRKAMPAMFVLMGVLFILRGMNLGIPYVSPQLDATTGTVHTCHVP